MTAQTSAGTSIAITTAAPATFTQAGFDALTFTGIGEVTSIDGEIGRTYNLVTSNPLSTRATRKYKGNFNSGSITLPLALDYDDAGQDIARASVNVDADRYFKLTFQDGDHVYFAAKVMSFATTVGNGDSIRNGSIKLEITATDAGADFILVELP